MKKDNSNKMQEPIIAVNKLKTAFGEDVIHENLDFTVYPKEILAIVGGSGTGKTTLLRSILQLINPVSGSIKVFNTEVINASDEQMNTIRHRWGVLFQHSALFGSLTLLENVMFPLREFTQLSVRMQKEIALLKLALVGLSASAANKYPAELSGGMQRRGALARAIALDPELLFLDEPTTGLDPKSAEELDSLILHLRDNLGLTIVMVTHDMDTLWAVTDKVAFLGNKKVLVTEPMRDLINNSNALIKEYFQGKRSKREVVINGR